MENLETWYLEPPLSNVRLFGGHFPKTINVETKELPKCKLKDCNELTNHNGGYCSAEHCRLDKERNKG